MKRSSFPLSLMLTFFISAASGCAGLVDDTSLTEPSCQPTLGDRLVRHACSHTENGPYTEIAAQSATSDPADVSKLHGPFDVTAVSVPFSLDYQASRPGTHVIFTDKPTTWEVAARDGVALELHTDVRAEESCAGTTYATVVEFERGRDYVLSSANAAKRFVLFIEHAGTFGEDAFTDACVK